MSVEVMERRKCKGQQPFLLEQISKVPNDVLDLRFIHFSSSLQEGEEKRKKEEDKVSLITLWKRWEVDFESRVSSLESIYTHLSG